MSIFVDTFIAGKQVDKIYYTDPVTLITREIDTLYDNSRLIFAADKTIARLTPAMQSNLSPSPFEVIFSSEIGGGNVHRAFTAWDQVQAFLPGGGYVEQYGWASAGNMPSGIGAEYNGIKLDRPRTVTSAILRNRGYGTIADDYNQAPRDFRLECSMDKVSWIVVSSVTDFTKPTSWYQPGNIPIPSLKLGLYWRIFVTKTWGANLVTIGEIELNGF